MSLKLITKNIRGVGSYGELYYKGSFIAYSVEREWLNNRKNVSCIPPGLYQLKWHNSPKFGKVIALENHAVGVTLQEKSQRTHCYIHSANYATELHGCIAFGTQYHPHKWGVADSRTATAMIYELFKNDTSITLEIIRL